nr:PASTA domain-containing protein [Actinomycetota bacterium]
FRGGTSRQAGSAFKPFTLVTALENAISPAQRYPAPPSIEIELPEDCRGPENEPVWPVQNYDGTGSGRPSVEEATISSLNVVYAQLVRDLGRGNPCDGAQLVVDVAKRMGIGSQLFAVPSATLGTNLVNTMEMARAYGTLATMGRRFDPMMVTRITDAEGHVLYQGKPHGEQAVNPGVAWTAVEIMKKVVQYGTGSAADIGRPAAGKTGTSQEWRNAWFVGFIPQLVASVWVGFPQGDIDMVSPRTRLFHVTGGTWPAMIWHEFMAKATATMPVQEFATPDIDFVFVTVDTNTGCLATDATPRRYRQNLRFVEGLEPSEQCEEEIGDLPVPSVVGLSKADAVATIQDYGFRPVVEIRAAADVEPGTVLSQSPAGGEQAPLASTVTITVAGEDPADAKVNVPNVVGLLRSGAIAILQAAGFDVNVVDQWRCRPPSSCGAQPNRVWDQEPNAGAQVQPGSTVTIWANEGG